MTESEVAAGKSGGGCGAGCASVVGLLLAVAMAVLAYASTDSTYPDVDPEKRARRLSGYSQDAYAALGIDRTVEGGYIDVDNHNTYDSNYCYPDGLFSFADPPVEGAYQLIHGWSIGKVDRAEALPALRRVRDHLKAEGWRITRFGKDEQLEEWSVKAERDGGFSTGITWEAEFRRLGGGSGGPCAMDPDTSQEKDEPYESYGKPELNSFPPAMTPGGR
ncbi:MULTISPECIES: hypothetical protein [Streptomyces]|uniref:Uncharacterized protein n=1 Tax=Streptomyces demainii TaxID=588122 RepID=A0ABT9KY96_9ACTN|nr:MULTISPECIES: hypothetical protein [Streptomyces]MCO8303958.1 hypothetical protein [Streptomyces sp. RKCA744]MDP9613419.1 hypothetical protein [Streptomyces demainii]